MHTYINQNTFYNLGEYKNSSVCMFVQGTGYMYHTLAYCQLEVIRSIYVFVWSLYKTQGI